MIKISSLTIDRFLMSIVNNFASVDKSRVIRSVMSSDELNRKSNTLFNVYLNLIHKMEKPTL